MRVLTRPPRRAALVIAVSVLSAASLLAVPCRAAQAGTVGGNGSGDCFPVDYTWICVYNGDNGGGPGSTGSSSVTCTFTPAPAGILERTGTGPPAPGYQWDIMTCPGSRTVLGGELIQVNIKTGVPAVSPVELLKIAIGELSVPTLTPSTAPPRGKDGLVGLPEWFWVPAGEWQPISITVRAGPVWATAVAGPTSISYDPGDGGPAVSCAGPGTPFDRARPAAAQRTSCSYTYSQPSAAQPGGAYQAAVFVAWTISWTGSGGAGGLITNGYTTGTTFGVRVAQAEALVTTP
jgi:hypothetical protein